MQEIPIDSIQPNPNNPRRKFDEVKLQELADSIRTKGVLQPILVRPLRTGPVLDDFTLLAEIAGQDERRPAAEAVPKLERHGINTYGHLKQRAKAHKDDLYAAIRTVPEVKVAEAKAIVAAIEDLQTRKQTPYQLVAGERRWRAAKLAGLATIPANVRQLSDQDVLEAMVIENEQREDTTAIEKSRGYAQLIEQAGHTIETIASKIGKSVSTVRGVLRLKNLPGFCLDPLEDGTLSQSIAELVASRPSAPMRQKAGEYALKPREQWGYGKRVQVLPSYRDVKEWIQRECMIELKQAPFNTKTDDLAETGACTTCPKRTGNCPEEYPDARADVCTDPTCYREKVKHWQGRTIADAEVKGQTILSEAEVKKLFPYRDRLAYDAPYFDLAQQCWEDHARKKPRSYKQLLDRHLKPSDIVLAFDPEGSLHRLVHKDAAIPILREQHGLFKKTEHGISDKTPTEKKAEDARRRNEARLKREIDRGILAAAAASAEKCFAMLPPDDPCVNQVLRVLLTRAIEDGWGSVLEDVCAQRQVKGGRKGEQVDALKQIATAATAPQLVGLLVEFAAGRLLLGFGGGGSPAGKDLVDALGLDRKKIEKEVKRRLKEEKAQSKGGKSKKAAAVPGVSFACLDCGDAESTLIAGRCPTCAAKSQDTPEPTFVPDADSVKVEDLELPGALVKKLQAAELRTVGDLRQFQHGDKSLAASLATLNGISFKAGRQVAAAVEGAVT